MLAVGLVVSLSQSPSFVKTTEDKQGCFRGVHKPSPRLRLTGRFVHYQILERRCGSSDNKDEHRVGGGEVGLRCTGVGSTPAGLVKSA